MGLDQSGVFVARLFGAANIGFATAVWLAAGGDSATQHALGWGVIAYSVVEAIAAIAAISGSVANPLAWAFVALDVVLVGACGFLMRPAAGKVLPARGAATRV